MRISAGSELTMELAGGLLVEWDQSSNPLSGASVKRTVVLALCLAAFSRPALGQEFLQWPQTVNWQIGTGFDYSEGKYGGTTKTTVWSIPVEARLELDRLRIELSLPYENVTGPGILAGGVIVGSGPVKSRSGLGELNLTGAFLLTHDDEFPAIDIGGTVKFPTAKTDLGTGKFDYSIQSNIYHSFTPRLMIFGSVGYQWLTSTSTIALKNGVTASGGLNFKATDDASVGVSLNF